MRTPLTACLAVSLLAACAAPERSGRVRRPDTAATVSGAEGELTDGELTTLGAAAPLVEPAPPAPRRFELDANQLALWNDPGFQTRFTESYIAETDVEPAITVVERDVMQEVLELISADMMDEAAVMLREEQTEDSSAVYDFTLANIYFQQDELELAEAEYTTAVEKYPKFRRAWQNKALIHVRQNEFPEAAASFTKVIELGGGNAVTYGLLGIAYSNLEQEISAESAFRMATLMDPGTVEWRMYLARTFFKQQRYADAVALTGNLIASDPDNTDLWMLQANAYIGMGQPLRAAENYEIVDRLGGATVGSLNNLGDIYINQELFDLAVDSYVRALDADPDKNVSRSLRAAKVLTGRGELDGAKRILSEVDGVHTDGGLEEKDRKEMLHLQARIAVAEGAGDEEARILEQIVELDPLDGNALLLLGQHAGRGGDVEKAIFYYERAAAIGEEFEPDAKVRHAQLLVTQGRYAEAIPLLRRAQTIKPRDNVQDYLTQVERVASQGR